MSEYRILETTIGETQKILNQWRHQYQLVIVSQLQCRARADVLITTVLRTPLEG